MRTGARKLAPQPSDEVQMSPITGRPANQRKSILLRCAAGGSQVDHTVGTINVRNLRALGTLVGGVGLAGLAEQRRKLCPIVGSIHVDQSDRFDARFRGLAIEQHRGFAGLDYLPERLFGRDQDCLIDRIGLDR